MRNNTDAILKEVHEIRAQMWEELKKMSVDERVKKINEEAKEFAKEYGVKIVNKV